jgi:hypothetical protein
MARLTAQERQWRAEERAEFDAEARAINRHRDDCLCRAVRDWSPGPPCYQQLVATPNQDHTNGR